jgi:hypothetical protein
MKEECKECGYYNPNKHNHYKCHGGTGCPACNPKKLDIELENGDHTKITVNSNNFEIVNNKMIKLDYNITLEFEYDILYVINANTKEIFYDFYDKSIKRSTTSE